jgi:hypothetical protein
MRSLVLVAAVALGGCAGGPEAFSPSRSVGRFGVEVRVPDEGDWYLSELPEGEDSVEYLFTRNHGDDGRVGDVRRTSFFIVWLDRITPEQFAKAGGDRRACLELVKQKAFSGTTAGPREREVLREEAWDTIHGTDCARWRSVTEEYGVPGAKDAVLLTESRCTYFIRPGDPPVLVGVTVSQRWHSKVTPPPLGELEASVLERITFPGGGGPSP